jgi:hypothetical protein
MMGDMGGFSLMPDPLGKPGAAVVLKPFVADREMLDALIEGGELLRGYPDFMSVQQVADLLGVCAATVRTMLNERTLFGRKANQRWVIPKLALCAWLLGEDLLDARRETRGA